MPEYHYSLLKYYPDSLRDEPINIGIILHSAREQYLGYHLDLRRAAHKLTRADKDTLHNFEEQFGPIENEEIDWDTARFESFALSEENFLSTVADAVGNKIRFAAPRGLLTNDPDQSLNELFGRFVSTGGVQIPRVTKGTIIKEVRLALAQGGIGEYVKSKPIVTGRHRNYTLPLGIRHSQRTFIDVLKLRNGQDSNYRAMAAVGRLWQDARSLPANNHAGLCILLHYANVGLPDGERLLRDDGVEVVHRPPEVLANVDRRRVREWTD
jgi:hypothetical protein